MTKQNILLVDDDLGTIRLLSRILADLGRLRFATSGTEALELARESAPDVILLDAEMPGMSGFEVCQALKADPGLADVPVIFVTCRNEAAFEVAGFEIGAADFIAKPVTAELVLARVARQLRAKHLEDQLRRIAGLDALTGLANRRRFDESLAREWDRAQRSGEAIALLLVDVDHFKLFNDRYGHPAGDTCLQAVARALGDISQRPGDLVARYGGEEFALLLPNTPRAGAEHMARRLLATVEALAFPHAPSPTASHVTVSIGVSCLDENAAGRIRPPADSPQAAPPAMASRSPDDLVKAADQALYVAKHAGRAQARVLDIADVGVPHLARDIAPTPGLGRQQETA